MPRTHTVYVTRMHTSVAEFTVQVPTGVELEEWDDLLVEFAHEENLFAYDDYAEVDLEVDSEELTDEDLLLFADLRKAIFIRNPDDVDEVSIVALPYVDEDLDNGLEDE